MQRYSTLLLPAFLFITLAGIAQVQIEPNAMTINAPSRTPGVALEILGLNDDDGGVIQLGNSDRTSFLSIFPGRLNDPDPLLLWKDNGALRFASDLGGYQEVMRLTPVGHVGIGTSTPAEVLDVIGNTRIEGRIELLAAPGDSSLFIGAEAGVNDDGTNNRNLGVGTGALHNNTTGIRNTANGYRALFSNTTGNYNNANGYEALYSNTTGVNNVASGFRTLFANLTGSSNIAVGLSALNANTTGNSNIAIGANALLLNSVGNENIALGEKSLRLNTEGGRNTAIGSEAMRQNITGNNNVAVGYQALYLNSTGIENVAIGYEALQDNTIGTENLASGYRALLKNTEGFSNVGVGHQALYENTTGINNVAVGASALLNNTTGGYNSALGRLAFSIGTNYSNSSALGYFAEPGASNTIRLGNNLVTTIGGNVDFTVTSDARFKVDVQEEVPGLDFIRALRPVTYRLDAHAMDDWQAQHLGARDSSAYAKKWAIEEMTFSGFLAQEVEAAAEAIGYDFSGVDKPDTEQQMYGLRYATFVVPLVKATQEQQLEIESLKSEVGNRKSEVEDLRSEIRDQKTINEELRNELDELRSLLEQVAGNQQEGNEPVILDQAPTLEQNEPNPFTGATRINYFLPDEALVKSGRAQLIITGVDGKELQRVTLAQGGRAHIDLQTRTYPAGTYQYSLVVDGQIIATKRMVLQR
jgi:trimeric autotransporter adhesin